MLTKLKRLDCIYNTHNLQVMSKVKVLIFNNNNIVLGAFFWVRKWTFWNPFQKSICVHLSEFFLGLFFRSFWVDRQIFQYLQAGKSIDEFFNPLSSRDYVQEVILTFGRGQTIFDVSVFSQYFSEFFQKNIVRYKHNSSFNDNLWT